VIVALVFFYNTVNSAYMHRVMRAALLLNSITVRWIVNIELSFNALVRLLFLNDNQHFFAMTRAKSKHDHRSDL
jgi:hypothetical protein